MISLTALVGVISLAVVGENSNAICPEVFYTQVVDCLVLNSENIQVSHLAGENREDPATKHMRVRIWRDDVVNFVGEGRASSERELFHKRPIVQPIFKDFESIEADGFFMPFKPDALRWGLTEILDYNFCFDPVINSKLRRVTILAEILCGLNLKVGSDLRLSYTLRIAGHLLSGDKSSPDQKYSNYSECGHDPLCKRIARANERPDEPIPPVAYLAVACSVIGLGSLIAWVLCSVVKPEE